MKLSAILVDKCCGRFAVKWAEELAGYLDFDCCLFVTKGAEGPNLNTNLGKKDEDWCVFITSAPIGC